jgi:prepilin-type processing-associated H-X9-DG protein
MAAWNMYANDNKDKLVNTQPYKVYCAWATGGAICPGGAAYQPGECGSNPDCGYNIYYREGQIGWIAWPHLWNTNTSPSTGSKDPPHSYCPGIKEIDATEADWQHGVACGGLWKYIRDFSLYRCPVGEKRAYVTYTGSSMMNGHYAHKFCEPLQSYSYRNRNQIKKPAMRMAFLDIGAVTCYSWDIAIAKNPSGGPCNPGYFGWLNPPPLRHGKGTTMSFADGHCEYRKWVDSRTQSGDLSCNQDCNKDIFYMQRIVCGGLNPEEIAAIPAGCKTE